MAKWAELADSAIVGKTRTALEINGIGTFYVQTSAEARRQALDLLPDGASVMDMTSVTLHDTGIADEINNSGRYDSVRNKLNSMDHATQRLEMKALGAAPEWTVGSVHAVTEDGRVLIASNTGSQLPAYAYGASHVIWVVGTQKIVANLDEAMTRIYEYTLPLESERAKKAYGAGSAVSKMLIVNREVSPGRLTMVLVNEVLGF